MTATAVLLVTDDQSRSSDVSRLLAGKLACDMVSLDASALHESIDHKAIIFDVDLSDPDTAQKVQAILPRGREDAARIFLTGRGSHHARVQAAAFGSAAVVPRPICPIKLHTAIFGAPPESAPIVVTPEVRATTIVAAKTVANVFAAAKKDAPLDIKSMNTEGAMIDDAVMQGEINQWIAAVRQHHSYTYRHCMLVSGITAAFSQQLGIGTPCRRRLMRAALLHDIGKASIPVAILDKPDKLSEAELIVMRGHPALGRDFLMKHHSAEKEVIDIVYKHHEMLDGSGYPQGLKADKISDAVRIITICDIFAAMIEPRPYKKTMTKLDAYAEMEKMGGKLDRDLLRAFKTVALALAFAFRELVDMAEIAARIEPVAHHLL
jgi:putative nucleotidyltransferase with HDIG domain